MNGGWNDGWVVDGVEGVDDVGGYRVIYSPTDYVDRT